MRRAWTVISVVAIALLACRERRPRRSRQEDPGLPGAAYGDLVRLPPGSGQLAQLRVEPVHEVEVAMERIEAPGKIELNPNRVFRVMLPVPGRVAEVYVKLGDAVRKSDPLLALKSPEADAAISGYLQAEAVLAQARSSMAKARADYDRLSDLYRHDAVALKDVLNAENVLAQARAAVDQAEASSRQALSRIEILGLQPRAFGQQIIVRAPLSGKVLEINVTAGEYRNDTTTSVMTIVDLTTVWISSDVPESAIRHIRLGERVDVELTAYPGEIFRARVTRIADTVDSQTRTVKVRAELANPRERFRPEMFGRIVHTGSVRKLPVVPAPAVLQEQGRNVVFREEAPGVFRRVPIRPGPPLRGLVPILEGIRAGERIVTQGVMLLQPG